jgi:hypothetical protein
MKTTCLDMLQVWLFVSRDVSFIHFKPKQFHWWDYEDGRYMDALRVLDGLRRENKVC